MATSPAVYVVRDGERVRVRLGGPLLVPYLELANRITRAIARGTLRSGDRLPSENALAEALASSRDTVRRAYLHLEREHGLISGSQGAGWYVS